MRVKMDNNNNHNVIYRLAVYNGLKTEKEH